MRWITPTDRAILACARSSLGLEHQASNLGVGGSNPSGRANLQDTVPATASPQQTGRPATVSNKPGSMAKRPTASRTPKAQYDAWVSHVGRGLYRCRSWMEYGPVRSDRVGQFLRELRPLAVHVAVALVRLWETGAIWRK